MKLATLLCGVCVAHTLLFASCNYLEEKWTYANGVVRSCDALPNRSTIPVGQLSLLAPVLCTTPKVLEIAADTIIRSHAPIRTRNVVFHVHRGARLTFHAPSVVLGRTETRTGDSILSGEGSVKFEVDSSAYDYLKGILTDEHGVVSLPYGSLDADHPVRYTSTSVIAADPSAAGKVTNEQVPLPPEFEEALARVHARINRNSDPAVTSSSPSGESSSSSLNTGSTGDGSTSPTLTPSSPSTATNSPDLGSSGTSDGDGAGANTIGGNSDESSSSSSSTGSPNDGANSPTLIPSSTSTETNSPDNSNPFSGDTPTGPRKVWANKTTPPPSRGSRWARPEKPAPREEATFSVKVGDALAGTLITSDGTAAVSFIGEDGSLRFSKELKNCPRDRKGKRIGPPMVSTLTLIPGDVDKMEEVLQRREEISAKEKQEETKGKVAAILGFVPYGKHGYRRRRALKHASAHLGEVKLTVDARGTVEGSVDGTVVLRRRGPTFLGFRRKDSSHEIRTDDNGLAVLRKGRRLWGVEAPEMWRRL